MSVTRRDLLKLGAGAAAAAVLGGLPSLGADKTKKRIPIALELYSLRDIAGKDVPGTLEAVAKMGYEGVEWVGWDNYYGRKAADLRKILDQTGLKSCGSHLNLAAITGDALKRTIEFNTVLGNQFLIISSLPRENMSSVAALMATAKLLTDLGKRVEEAGMRVGYHCHSLDFKAVADRIPWEVIFTNAGPQVVMQLDVGNCLEGGGDPVALLKKFPHRAATVHLKEHGGPQGAVIGEGDVPWQRVFSACETTAGTEWYIVEQESYRNSSLESAKLCLENLRKMGK